MDQHFESWKLVAEEWWDDGENIVVASGHLRLHGKESGVAFDRPMAWLIELDGARLRRLSNFDDAESALRAGGLVGS